MSDAPQQVGPYRIERELGRGGMGVVYLAEDPRLGRQVAIKALPEDFAADVARLERFEREARTLAQVSHPNIAGIYGVEEQEGSRYLVLEFVEGDELAARLDRGPLPVEEAIEIACQIAAGVAAAHDAGVIHRDLKPANIKLTADGDAKVLDFGLARSDEANTSSSTGAAEAATMTTPAIHSPTMPGVILGTAAYMSPEQARGRKVDKRTDVWSFGVVLYEMLTGASPFVGETVSDSIGAVLHKDPDLARLPADTPLRVRRALRRCLERDRDRRYRDIGDARLELLSDEPSLEGAAPNGGLRLGGVLIGALVGAALGASGMFVLAPMPQADSTIAAVVESSTPTRRFSINLPESAPVAPPSAYPFGIARSMFDLSDDGRLLVYTTLVDGQASLRIRDMETGDVRPVRGSEGGYFARFGPGGEQIAFFTADALYRMDTIQRTDPERIARSTSPQGLAWGADGSLYYIPTEQSPVIKIPPGGNERDASDVTLRDQRYSRTVAESPDSSRILFSQSRQGMALFSTPIGEPGDPEILVESGVDPRFFGDDRLLYMSDGRLIAAPVEPDGSLTGDPTSLLSGIRYNWSYAQFAVSNNGMLVYAPGGNDALARFVWVNADGSTERLGLEPQVYGAFELSPDGRRLATPIQNGQDEDIWVYDLDRPRAPARITFGGVFNETTWSSGGRYLFFTNLGDGVGRSTMFVKDMRSSAPARPVECGPGGGTAYTFDESNGELLFGANSESGGADIMRGKLSLPGQAGAPLVVTDVQPIAATVNNEPFAALSPDRNWVAANSNETGRWEIYLSSYPDGGRRTQISTTGAEEPRWTADGGAVIYRWNDVWYRVDIETEPALRVSEPREIAQGPYINVGGYSWDMTPDGSRLLLLEGPTQDTPFTRLEVITGFDAEVDRALGRD